MVEGARCGCAHKSRCSTNVPCTAVTSLPGTRKAEKRCVEAGCVLALWTTAFPSRIWPRVLFLYLRMLPPTTMASSLEIKFTQKYSSPSTIRLYPTKGFLRRHRYSMASTWIQRPTFVFWGVNWFNQRVFSSGYPRYHVIRQSSLKDVLPPW